MPSLQSSPREEGKGREEEGGRGRGRGREEGGEGKREGVREGQGEVGTLLKEG